MIGWQLYHGWVSRLGAYGLGRITVWPGPVSYFALAWSGFVLFWQLIKRQR